MWFVLVAFAAFGLQAFTRQLFRLADVEFTESAVLYVLFGSSCICTVFFRYLGVSGQDSVTGFAAFGAVVLLLEVFRLLQVCVDVQRTRVLLAAQERSRVARP